MSKEWDKENMRTVSANVKKEDAEAFRKFAEEKGVTMGALLRNFMRDSVASVGSPSAREVGSVRLPVSYKNVDRINAEIAHHNPTHVRGDDMLDHILDRYFSVAAQFRK